MATKKKTKKKQAKARRTSARKAKPRKVMAKKTAAKRMAKKPARKKPVRKKAAVKIKASGKAARGKAIAAPKRKPQKKQVRRKSQDVDPVEFSLSRPVSRSTAQSGDLQGLSRVEGANSESVDELLEEGNAFEADVVKGVEDGGDAEGREVHTHEVLEDDVPEEYLDQE